MKKLLLLLTTLCTINGYSSHILGGFINVVQTSYDSTSIGLTLLLDHQGVIPNSVTVSKWEHNSVGFYVQNGYITLTQGSVAIPYQGDYLVTYTSNYLDLDSNAYRFIYQNCCYGVISNSTSSQNSSVVISTDYLHIPNNSTPSIGEMNVLYHNQQVSIRNTMTPLMDPNPIKGFIRNKDPFDVVVISQDDLFGGHANNVFVPQVYNYNNMSLHIDNDSISWIPPALGQYGVGIKIEDYRNGTLIGTQRIQWIFNVVTSTVGIEELTKSGEYKVYDWYGNYMGTHIKDLERSGLYVLRYSNGYVEKIYYMFDF